MTGGCNDESESARTLDALIEGVARRDTTAFDELHHRIHDRLLSTIRRQLIDIDQSLEVLQEVWLEIWLTAAKFTSGRGSALAWMSVMAQRRAIDRVRASQASRQRDLRIGMRDRDVVTGVDTIGDALQTRIDTATVLVIADTLTDAQRQAIDLVYLRDHTLTEAAEIAGISYSSMRTRVRDGIIRIRRELLTAATAAPATRRTPAVVSMDIERAA